MSGTNYHRDIDAIHDRIMTRARRRGEEEQRQVRGETTETLCYGTVMCGFASPYPFYRENDPDLVGKVAIVLGPRQLTA